MKICVYGAASDLILQKYKDICFELGAQMVKRGHSLVYGAGGHGVMGATARGVTSENGYILGIVPTFFKEQKTEHLYEGCSKVIWTETMYERKELLEENSDAFIIAPGGIGTYDEFFAVLTNKQLGQHEKPIAVFNAYGFYNEFLDIFNKAVNEGFLNASCMQLFKFLDTPEEVIKYIETAPVDYDKSKLKNG